MKKERLKFRDFLYLIRHFSLVEDTSNTKNDPNEKRYINSLEENRLIYLSIMKCFLSCSLNIDSKSRKLSGHCV